MEEPKNIINSKSDKNNNTAPTIVNAEPNITNPRAHFLLSNFSNTSGVRFSLFSLSVLLFWMSEFLLLFFIEELSDDSLIIPSKLSYSIDLLLLCVGLARIIVKETNKIAPIRIQKYNSIR